MGQLANLPNRSTSALSLDDRIANAFEAQTTSTAIAALLDETKQAEQASIEAANKAQAVALDPATRPAAVTDARREMEDAQFRCSRMEAAASRLRSLHADAVAREAKQDAAKEYAAAKAERDDLVKDLKAYDEHAGAIVSLLSRLARSNLRLKTVNRGQSAEGWLYTAEMIARDAPREIGLAADGGLPELLTGVRLPSFLRDAHGYAWPPVPASN